MTTVLNVASLFFACLILYFGLGVLMPELPLVRTRSRGAIFAGLSFVGWLVIQAVFNATLGPEFKRQLAESREASDRQAAERRSAEVVESARKAKKAADAAADAASEAAYAAAKAAEAVEAKWNESEVKLQNVLAAYVDNEVAADNRFKGQPIQLTGFVGDVKKDILGKAYVIVGTGKEFEIPTAQCFLVNSSLTRASTLHKGDKVTIRGTVGGLMFNVQIENCMIR